MKSQNVREYKVKLQTWIKGLFLWILVASVVYVILLVLENYVGPTFNRCVYEGRDYYGGHADNKFGFIRFSWTQNTCTLALFDRHSGFFAFLGTVAVAGFTLALWRSTDKLWEAGERQIAIAKISAEAASASAKAALIQARGLVAAERACMTVDKLLSPVAGGWYAHATNAGRTRAHCKICVIQAFSELPDSKDWVIENMMQINLDMSVAPDMKIPIGIVQIPREAKHVLGRLTYVDVFAQTHHEWFHYVQSLGNWIYLAADEWNRIETISEY